MHLAVVSGSMRAAVIVVAIVVVANPSHASKSCMTQAEARAQFATSHLYWHGSGHCWDATPPRHDLVRRVRPKEHREAQRDTEEAKPPAPRWREAMSEMLPAEAVFGPPVLPASPVPPVVDADDPPLSRANWLDRWVDIAQTVPLALLARGPEPADPAPAVAPKAEPLVTTTRVMLTFLSLVLALAIVELLFRATIREGRR